MRRKEPLAGAMVCGVHQGRCGSRQLRCSRPAALTTGLGNEVIDAIVAASPLKRLGNPDEVADLVLWLCSAASSFNTGAVFDMSGGRARY